MNPIKCKIKACGKLFSPRKFWQKYCSVACRQKAYRERKKNNAVQTAGGPKCDDGMTIKLVDGNIRYLGTGSEVNPQSEYFELYINGEFVCSWETHNPSLSAIIVAAFEAGKSARSAEIRKLL